MKDRICDREEAVVRAFVSGGMTPPLQAHLDGCAECREAMAVTSWMKDVAAAAREAAAEGLPAAAEIWWRAEVLARVERRRSLVHEAVKPIALFERWAGVVAAVGVAALTWLQADRITAWIVQAGVSDALADPSNVWTAGLAVAAGLAVSAGWLMERMREA